MNQQQAESIPDNRTGIYTPARSKPAIKYLKWAGISILSLLLFLSLFVFGPAFLFKQTVLNPAFVNSEVNKLELASLVNEVIAQGSSQDLPEEIADAVSHTVSKIEPRFKEELNTFITSIYDYLLGKKENPELPLLIRSTFLNSEFLGAIINELDLTALMKPIIYEQANNWIPQMLEPFKPFIYPAIDDMLESQEPWIKQQIINNIDQIADYLVGLRDGFNITIPMDPVVKGIKDYMLKDVKDLPLPQVIGLPPEMVEAVFNDFFDEFSQYIPVSFSFDESIIGEDVPQQVRKVLTEGENAMAQMKDYISTFQLGYNLLIAFMVLLTIGIILVFREVRGATRTLGIVFLIFGAIELLSRILINNVFSQQMAQATAIPSHLHQWLLQFVSDVSAPLQILSIGFIIGGIVLIVVSVVYKPRRPALLH